MVLYSPSLSSVASFSEVSTAPTTPVAGDTPAGPPYVLVLGGLGFIGSHTVLELLKAGHNVVIVDDLSNSFSTVSDSIREAASLSCSATGRTMPSLKFHEMDYCAPGLALVLDSYHISGVIHFAAFKSVSESIAAPLDYYMNNVCELVSLLKLLGSYGIKKFVFSSSATVYGTKAEKGIPLREEDVVHHPLTYERDGETVTAVPGAMGLTSPYGRSKYFGEAILADLAYSDPSWNILALRYFNPIGCDASGLLGEDPRGVPTNLFPVLAQVLTGDRAQLEIFGSDWDTRDGTAVRDFIHVSDLARGHIAALDAKVDAPFRTFNLGTGTGTTVSEALGALEAASGRAIPAVRVPRREGDVGSCVAANSRATTELGWSTTESLLQSARDLWGFVSRVRAIPSI
ncbi:hypothetical protein CspeluHIS016_0115170 [Cutaneotrichosporon spelunceum]|uniref:NAD-dependent epimerase/dehydratase domain-containing protein n=1 Tax=Cutaneotrichosporon spelunceum TaxID=1672016 RepID=A0AAD3TQZ4_9TREE|nr:hypothetical protein CspeluHIS016_0115170 [Cutaneotrichosporon spelunceum]